MASITLKNIMKKYANDVTAVNNFNLDIKDREFVVLVGPSGCGKSTTLRMIAGLEDITEGELYIGDRKVNDVAPKDRNIAMVFQNYALYPNLTVYKNMEFGLKMRKVKKDVIKRKVEETAKILEIEELLNRRPAELSGGQRQRVALGRAMVREPEVFLLDEPLSNLDAKLRAQMRTEIIKTHKRLDTTFVYVTHDQTEAMTMSDRMVVMKDGFIQQADAPEKIYEYPANMFVAGFIGSPQMNFMDGKIKKDGKTYRLDFMGYSSSLANSRFQREVLETYLDKSVVIGIRPENITVSSYRQENDGYFCAKLEIKELLGSEEYLYFAAENKKIVAKVSGRSVINENEDASLNFDMNKLHLFDPVTEESILLL